MTTQNLPPRSGLSAPIVTSIPEKWDREWFRSFITYFLQLGKVIQNAIVNGAGISISVSSTGQQQISLANQTGPSVLGVSGGAPAAPAAIIATADGQVLQRSAGSLIFAPVGGGSTSTGTPGPAGADGIDGEEGPMGPVGPQGAPGPVGYTGASGNDGDPGDDGLMGFPTPPATQPVALPQFTVATLPPASAALKGSKAYVTDATAPTYNAALVGGGAVIVPVFCNGTAWVSA